MYNFPPIGGPRSLRWLNLIKSIYQKNWEIDVLTINASSKDSYYDETLLSELPASIRVHRSFPGVYYSLIHFKRKPVRGFSKTTLEWLPFGLWKGRRLIRLKDYDAVVSSALPFVGHLVAYFLKRKANIPWVADYGDPLGFNPITSNIKRVFGKYVEKHILKHADGIVVPFEEMKKEFLRVYPFLRDETIRTIGQGIDEKIETIKPKNFRQKFVLSYVGSFYKDVHEPYNFFKALRSLQQEHELMKDLRVLIAGNTEKTYVDYAHEINIDGFTSFIGQVSFEEAVSILKGSSAILYLGGKRDDYHFPSKVLVSAAAESPVIAIQQSETDLGADFIRKNRLGIVVHNKKEEIKTVILELYKMWKEKRLDTSFSKLSKHKFYWHNRGRELEQFLIFIIRRFGL